MKLKWIYEADRFNCYIYCFCSFRCAKDGEVYVNRKYYWAIPKNTLVEDFIFHLDRLMEKVGIKE